MFMAVVGRAPLQSGDAAELEDVASLEDGGAAAAWAGLCKQRFASQSVALA